MATYDQWLDAFSTFYDSIPRDAGLPCLNCGQKTLRLVFTGYPERMIGYGHFWCDTCLVGIGICRAPIPEGAVMQNIHDAPEDREPKIPNFQLVQG